MTIDDFAVINQREFMALHEEIHEIREGQNGILIAIDRIDMHLSSYASQWNERFTNLTEQVDGIDSRVKFLEKK